MELERRLEVELRLEAPLERVWQEEAPLEMVAQLGAPLYVREGAWLQRLSEETPVKMFQFGKKIGNNDDEVVGGGGDWH